MFSLFSKGCSEVPGSAPKKKDLNKSDSLDVLKALTEGLIEKENEIRKERDEAKKLIRSRIILHLDPVEGKIIDVNERAERYFEKAEEELLGKKVILT